MAYNPEIRLREEFFQNVFLPMVGQHCWIIKYDHWGIFFRIHAAYVPFRVMYPLGYPALKEEIPRAVMERFIGVLEHREEFPQYYLRIIWRDRRSMSVRLHTLRDAQERLPVEYKRHGGMGEYIIYQQSLQPGDVPGSGREDVRYFARFVERFKYGGEVVFEDYFPESGLAHECLRAWEKQMPHGHGAVYASIGD